MLKESALILIDENGYWTLRGGGESVPQNFGQFSTFHKLTEQQIFISFSQTIYIKESILYLFK